MKKNKESVDIRPTVGYLSILPSISYKAWYAIAEFVDNSLQSYLDNKNKLRNLHGKNWKLRIGIYITKTKIQIKIQEKQQIRKSENFRIYIYIYIYIYIWGRRHGRRTNL